jgi:hypothetical protein
MNGADRARAERLRRAVEALDGDAYHECVDCWHAGPGRLCARHCTVGQRAIDRIRAERGWAKPVPA